MGAVGWANYFSGVHFRMRSLVQFCHFKQLRGRPFHILRTHSHIFVKVLLLRNIKDAWLLKVAGLSLCLIPT